MADTSTKICGIALANPTVLPAGFMGLSAGSLLRAAEAGAGAVTMKSAGKEPRAGHNTPVVASFEAGLLNAVGLSNAGADETVRELKKAVALCKAPVIASFFGKTADEFAEVAALLAEAKPAMLEANISCPNVHSEFGTPFAFDPAAAASVVAAVKEKTKMPLSVKLSPNTPAMLAVAEAVAAEGADAITAINTVGPGMLINIETRKPVLTNKTGGVSGAAIKPIAVRCVYELYGKAELPIIGVGGVSSGRDAVEMLMAGASAVGIGTAIMHRGLGVFGLVAREIAEFMDANGYSRVSQLVGAAHE